MKTNGIKYKERLGCNQDFKIFGLSTPSQSSVPKTHSYFSLNCDSLPVHSPTLSAMLLKETGRPQAKQLRRLIGYVK